MFRCDRHDQERGGGVCVFVKNSLSSFVSLVDVTSLANQYDVLTFDFLPFNREIVRFVCVYLPPSSVTNQNIINSFAQHLNKSVNSSNTYVLGDFNLSKIDWNLAIEPNNLSLSAFVEFVHRHSLVQLIKTSTHISGSILDLLFASQFNEVIKISIEEPFSSSCDHCMIDVWLSVTNESSSLNKPKRNFYNANYNEINALLSSVKWSSILSQSSIEQNYASFLDVLYNSINLFVPKKRSLKQPSLPKHLKSLLVQKRQLYKLSKSSPLVKLKYNRINKLYKAKTKEYFKNKEQQILCSGSIKKFHAYVNSKLNCKTSIPPLSKNNVLITDSTEKASVLNKHFLECFLSKDSDISKKDLPHISINKQMPLPQITIEEITASIKKLKKSVSRSPDSIPSIFVKNTAMNLIYPLSIIFNQSLNSGKLPSLWTQAIVVPIHKKGLRSNPKNYRPISLTSIFCRLLEAILHQHISKHLTVNKLLSHSQHGFLENRSTVTQQHTVMNIITDNTNNKVQTDMIMLDFSKAFDRVSHLKLLSVLNAYHIPGEIIAWIRNLLMGRTQRTVVNSVFSESVEVRSGVPQGSVLGPLLFNIYLNDLLRKLNSIPDVETFAFADDLKLISINPSSLQTALNLVKSWCNTFKLDLNPEKSEHISFCEKQSNCFYIEHSKIKTVDFVKDLGVVINSKLKWNQHISKITSKAQSLSYLLLRCFSTQDKSAYMKSFKSYVRPLLEYNCTIWNSKKRCDIVQVEKVQKHFTRRLLQKLNTPFSSYADRLKILNIEILQTRRMQLDLILLYKIINKQIDLDLEKFFKPLKSKYNLRHHKFTLCRQPLPKTCALNESFKYHVIDVWKSLQYSSLKSSDHIALL